MATESFNTGLRNGTSESLLQQTTSAINAMQESGKASRDLMEASSKDAILTAMTKANTDALKKLANVMSNDSKARLDSSQQLN